jgi:hypothetical protein
MPKRLTAAGVLSLRANANKSYEVSDGGSALGVVVYPSGRMSWIVRYRRPSDAKQVKLTLGPVDFSAESDDAPVIGPLSLAGARQLAAQALRAKALGRDPAAQHKASKAAQVEIAPQETIGDVVALYVADKAKRNRGWRTTARQLGALVATWRSRSLSSITADDCHTLVERARTGFGLKHRLAGASESRARLAHSLLSGLLT